ncbi:MAG: glutaminyl-peptide cyclotransferase [Actinobacteria bacterium]|nr:glutaminyl-peptide cyclotransferase [Actinomycetota bacterium]NIS34618.1 glutaminyl-peptide cyclotransferase [Actinomycetota bacterium]NIT97625.1 glutaminyl-peptide cyclotransferase [Actinomycetota bacterium]NIU21275.1 glutaminyl-peptide cyclotransferase [Actinomycetota bacterium]NIU69378.1 glutaminyl-peptide cyclotransferase [Actinomycetota bacterium]
MNRLAVALGVTAAVILTACGDDAVRDSAEPPVGSSDASVDGTTTRWTVEIVRELPHDPQAFTQGLELFEGRLFESTGRESTLRELDPATGEVVALVTLEQPLFGEGLTVIDGEIIQLTWRDGRALRWDVDTLEPVGEFGYAGEGWGICALGDELVMSDGTPVLTRRDPVTFAPLDTVTVRRDGEPVALLNELECLDDGTILANVWKADEIVMIDPASGAVVGTVDASVLRETVNPTSASDVLNGIADLGDGTFLLGGKNWDRHFVVRLVPR